MEKFTASSKKIIALFTHYVSDADIAAAAAAGLVGANKSILIAAVAGWICGYNVAHCIDSEQRAEAIDTKASRIETCRGDHEFFDWIASKAHEAGFRQVIDHAEQFTEAYQIGIVAGCKALA